MVTQDVARSGSTDRRAENAHVIATCDLTGFFRREAARYHRAHEMHPFRVFLQRARSDLLVRSDADVIHANNVDHFLEAIDVLFKAGEEMPNPDRATRFGNRSRVVRAYLAASERRRTHRG